MLGAKLPLRIELSVRLSESDMIASSLSAYGSHVTNNYVNILNFFYNLNHNFHIRFYINLSLYIKLVMAIKTMYPNIHKFFVI